MNAYFDRLMVHIPNGYDKQAHEAPSLSLNGTGNVTILGDRLYVSTGAQSVTIDLHNQKVSAIVSQLPNGVSATVIQDGMAELLLLPYQYDNSPLPVTLNIATNGLWYIVGAMARQLESRKRSLLSQVAQINVSNATGRILDWWGATLGVERLTGEPDVLFAQRIVSLKFEPNVNNFAIENILAKLGYSVQVTDSAYGKFDVSIQLPTSPPNGFFYTTAQIADTIAIIKAAGVYANIVLQGALQDAVHIHDSISNSLPPASWKVGDSLTIGQFTV